LHFPSESNDEERQSGQAEGYFVTTLLTLQERPANPINNNTLFAFFPYESNDKRRQFGQPLV
jgi:hypothetical protein